MELPLKEEFNFKDCVIAGDECWLITPKDMSTKWSDDNARFRSCIVRKSDNFVVSQGFGKFTNFGERPEFQPWDKSWKIEARHKLDGSLLIVSKYKGELIIRTRGTVDARQLPNGNEIDILIKKYNLFFETIKRGPEDLYRSYLFEWTTPSNIIVLREHDQPTLTLIGIASHEDSMRYASQQYLDDLSSVYGLNRPQKYEYNTIEECILDVDAWRGKEGVVLYSPDGQTLKKIKASEYCELHKLATGIKTVEQVMDLFIASPRFYNAEDFYKYVETTLDYEIAEKIKDDISIVVQAFRNYTYKLIQLKDVVKSISFCESRKDQANVITTNYSDWRRAFAFKMLDKQVIDIRLETKAMHSELEEQLKR